MPSLHLYAIRAPDGVEVSILGSDALNALCRYHGEALGHKAVRVRGELKFRDPADQELCQGVWVVCRQHDNSVSPPILVVEVPPPSEQPE
jgi:hypothetical protein